MVLTKPLHDPLGNTIVIPSALFIKDRSHSLTEIREVVTEPAYMIRVRDEALYFFRLLDWDMNILVEAEVEDGGSFVVTSCSENPSAEYISGLLRKGGLIAFR